MSASPILTVHGQWNFAEESRSASEENIGFSIVQAQPVCHHPGVNLIDTGLELMDGGEGVRNAEGNFQLRVIGIHVEVQVMLADDLADRIGSVHCEECGTQH